MSSGPRRVFVAGASGAVGVRLVPLLVAAGPDAEAELSARAPANARMLREGARNLVDAAGDAHIVGQSIAWKADGALYEELEATILGVGGGVVRFGQLYGPGTHHESGLPDPPRIHVDTAARRAFEAMDAKGVVTAVDEE